ncbi:MAG: AcrR family transcriptional regulator, partial [Cognaticolwellia sp.]
MIQAATQLFLEQGFESSTMDQVADAAGVSRRTLFRYFPSKVDLVFPEHDRRLSNFEEELALDPAAPAMTRVQRALLTLVADCEAGSEQLLQQAQIVAGNPALLAAELELDSQWEAAMARTLSQDMNSTQARLMAGALSGLTRATLREWLTSGTTIALRELAL